MKKRIDNLNVRISGRTTLLDGVLYLGFSGSYIEFVVTGKLLSVDFVSDEPVMREDKNSEYYCPGYPYSDDTLLGQVMILLDGKQLDRFALNESRVSKSYLLEAGSHEVKIIKMNEAAFGLVGIEAIDTEGEIIPSEKSERRIEFIGDSITCGYGVEGILDKDVFCTEQENPTKAYAILTANRLSADYQLVSWSGIGIITNWVPETVNEPLEEILMPWLYPYRDRRLCERKNLPLEEWDFSEYVPDVIVIYLGTNDASYVRSIPERQEYFGGKYGEFLEYVHEKNKKSAILGILGTMDGSLIDEERRRFELFNSKYPDVKAEFMALPLQNNEDGIGTDSHPSAVTHQKASELVASKIKEMMNW